MISYWLSAKFLLMEEFGFILGRWWCAERNEQEKKNDIEKVGIFTKINNFKL